MTMRVVEEMDISFGDGGLSGSEKETNENNNSKQQVPPSEPIPSSSAEEVGVTSKSAKTFKCDYCPYSSRSRGNVYIYKQSVHRKIKLRCDSCPKVFTQQYDLNEHRKCIHENLKLMCEVCSKCFNSRVSLRRYKLVAHTNEVKFTCAICCKQFHERALYLGHMNNHVDAKLYRCIRCKKGFAFKSSMERHMVSCGRHETEHYCRICEKEIYSMNLLNAHISGVYGNKDKRCPYGNTFSWSSSLGRHCKSCIK